MTGTVLSGSMKVGMEIEFPDLKQQRKIKSMQMFKQPVQAVAQGDRVGVCVTQLDAKALERGIACTQGHASMISSALVNVRQIRFFKTPCKTGAKFHFTVGHTTVMVTATFFGKSAALVRRRRNPHSAELPKRSAMRGVPAVPPSRQSDRTGSVTFILGGVLLLRRCTG